jgi:hypothetical protein
VALKPKAKSFELDILSEPEMAIERSKDSKPREEKPRGPWLSPMGKEMHAGVDMRGLDAMNDEELELFDALRQRGTYVVVIKKGKKYYLESRDGDVDPLAKALKTKLIEDLIKKGWLARSVRGDYVAYFVTSHMVYGWRKRVGI